MVVIEPFKITYDNPTATYQPGGVLCGTLHVGFSDSTKVRKIFINVSGYCYVAFETGSGDNKEWRTAKQTYIDQKIYVYGREGADETEHPAGNFEYKFQLELPSDLPQSLEAGYGYIRYQCHATMDLPWKFDKECIVPFNITRTFDLNLLPAVKMPVMKEDTAKVGFCFGSCCCQWGTVQATLWLPRAGFTPGETVPFRVDFHNRSSRVIALEVYFEELKTFRAEGHTKRTDRTVVKRVKVVESDSTDTWQDTLSLPLTDLRCGTLDPCTIMSLQHRVVMKAGVTCGLHMEMGVNVFLGHIPLIW